MVEPVRSGRTPAKLTREFEPSPQAVRTWTKTAARLASHPPRRLSCASSDGRTAASRKRGRSWQKPRPGSLGRPAQSLRSLRVPEPKPTPLRRQNHVPRTGSLHRQLLRLMKAAGLGGVSRNRKAFTTRRDGTAHPAPDLVDRRFQVDAPDKLWVADITYIPTWEGFLSLAVVIDGWSRKAVGWHTPSRAHSAPGQPQN